MCTITGASSRTQRLPPSEIPQEQALPILRESVTRWQGVLGVGGRRCSLDTVDVAPSVEVAGAVLRQVIDVLLDLSTQDFAARPWVERMENARTIEALAAEVEGFIQSPLGAKSPALHAPLRRALG